MKKKEKSRNQMKETFDREGQKKTKLKPVQKQKYGAKSYFQDDEDGEIDLFNFDTDQ
ncbi:MAG: hypothetical protein R2769_02565 [Saprospiraceae bacterium]